MDFNTAYASFAYLSLITWRDYNKHTQEAPHTLMDSTSHHVQLSLPKTHTLVAQLRQDRCVLVSTTPTHSTEPHHNTCMHPIVKPSQRGGKRLAGGAQKPGCRVPLVLNGEENEAGESILSRKTGQGGIEHASVCLSTSC